MEMTKCEQSHSFYGGTREVQPRFANAKTIYNNNRMRMERNRRRRGRTSLYESSSKKECRHHKSLSLPPSNSMWHDNELKRQRRVAKYKRYEVEGKTKSSLHKGFTSFKITCKKMVDNLI
ncbi:hypothetical protein Fmac_024634 [Flemingia macrophylla]|uniref:Uncharacterized protein n=1 Tax=Flemingia macrophylla TaxID=520843 RepID=A0ABD1LPX8_9FABA